MRSINLFHKPQVFDIPVVTCNETAEKNETT